ncbi:MAG: hypothetical protein OFPI_03080 [Osedax symbiont Rs2]|nr:MAG: hypothetical protein OFPI_03080 [Osedax symbiont Rs2]
MFQLNVVRSSLQSELSQFFSILDQDTELLTWGVWKSSYCEARKKFSASAFVELNQLLTHEFYQNIDYRQWRGHRLLAVDSSIIKLPAKQVTEDAFGKVNKVAKDPSARLSTLYDPLNNITLDLKVTPCSIGERSLAHQHLKHARQGDIIIYDRGYPAAWLMALHQEAKIDYCFRAPWSYCPETRAFWQSEDKERTVTLKISTLSSARLDELGVTNQKITVRLVRVDLPESEESEVLITSLIDYDDYPYDEFAWLYHQRWAIEESYKSLKSQFEIENFTGYSQLAIEQDIQAKSLSKNIIAVIASQVQVVIKSTVQQKVSKRNYKINFAAGLRDMKNNMVRLFISNTPNLLIKRLLLRMIKNRQPVRPGRKFSRVERRALLKYPMRYKRC